MRAGHVPLQSVLFPHARSCRHALGSLPPACSQDRLGCLSESKKEINSGSWKDDRPEHQEQENSKGQDRDTNVQVEKAEVQWQGYKRLRAAALPPSGSHNEGDIFHK